MDVREALGENNRAVATTHRRDGGLQSSPVRVRATGPAEIAFITRGPAAKARNLARDPRLSLCVVSDSWFGPWLTIEGRAEVVPLPDAMPLLRDFYRWRDGGLPPEEEFVAMVQGEQRVYVRVAVERTAAPAV
jgi:PPOX class probable F420-dependent enzyme